MNKIHLAGTGIETTPLGFGCGQLMRISSASERQNLLNSAYDAGICHFDVARMYGLGEAENALGKFIKGKRDDLVIATKFGIELNTSGIRLAKMQGVARSIIELFPFLRKLARRGSSAMMAPRNYDSRSAQISLEHSLRELGTDYVDLFMLHEPSLDDVHNSDILDFLESAKRQGKIKEFGISGSADDVVAIYRSYPELAPLIQIPNNAVTRDIEKLPSEYNGAIITYSPFSSSLKMISQYLKSDTEASNRWSESIGLDCALSDNLASLLLSYCKSVLPDGVVLFSSSKPERLQMLVESVSNISSSHEHIDAFIKCVNEDLTLNKH